MQVPYSYTVTKTYPPLWYDSGHKITLKKKDNATFTVKLFSPYNKQEPTNQKCRGSICIKCGGQITYGINNNYNGIVSQLRDTTNIINSSYTGEGSYTTTETGYHTETKYRKVDHVWYSYDTEEL